MIMMIIWINTGHHTDHDIYHDNVYNNDHCDCDTKDASELLDEKLIILSFENHIYISNKMIRSQSYSHLTPTISEPSP